ncbi:terpene synthase family protein [Parapedobacter tibetensis]|uniref:terpene synthase family protein n=1 Tax=Parapedobacter tibetensis TaxID=2972951 RepID=UPI00214D80D1|nr:terpene synthase family protein [Parapedobacter tibetensis]
MKTKFKAPIPKYPWPYSQSPLTGRLAEEGLFWYDTDYDFLSPSTHDKYKNRHQLVSAAEHMSCTTTNVDHLRPIARVMIWLTIFDDYYELCPVSEMLVIRDHLVAILLGETPKSTDIGIYRDIAHSRDEFLRFMPYEWMERVAEATYRYITYGMIEETPYKLTRTYPSLAHLMIMREYSITVPIYSLMVDPAINFMLPKQVNNHPVIQRLRSVMCQIMSIQNDFFSLQKELERDTEVINILFVLQHEFSMSMEEACTEALRIHDGLVAEFVALHKALPDFGAIHKDVDNYVLHMGMMIQGLNVWYQGDTVRYVPSEFPYPEYSQPPV